MKEIRIPRINTRLIAIYLVIFAVLIDSETMYRYLLNSPIYGKGFGWPLGILCLLYIVQTKKIKTNYSFVIRLPIILLALVIYIIATRYNTNRFIVAYIGTFVAFFLFAYALYQNGDIKLFFSAFSKVMFLIAIVSLFFWLFGSLMNILPGRTTLTYDWAEEYRTTYTYFYLYFENPVQNIGHGTICNLGIFAESPGYSGFLTYAMLIELAFRKGTQNRKRKRECTIRILIYIITLISTNSTKGILAVLIAFAIEYIFKETKNIWYKMLKVLVCFVMIFGVAIAGNILVEKKLGTSSGLVRLDDLTSGLKTFFQHPIFGAGYNNVDAIIKNRLNIRTSQGLSMGLTVLLAYGGLWMFSIYAGAAVVSYKNPYFRKNRKTWLLVIMVLLYNLFISNSAFSDAYIFMVAAAYAAPSRRQNNEVFQICNPI